MIRSENEMKTKCRALPIALKSPPWLRELLRHRRGFRLLSSNLLVRQRLVLQVQTIRRARLENGYTVLSARLYG